MGRKRAAALLKQQQPTIQRDAKGKPRGGASHACPRCSSRTEVIETRRQESGIGVRRIRRCIKRSCLHQFETIEEVTR